MSMLTLIYFLLFAHLHTVFGEANGDKCGTLTLNQPAVKDRPVTFTFVPTVRSNQGSVKWLRHKEPQPWIFFKNSSNTPIYTTDAAYYLWHKYPESENTRYRVKYVYGKTRCYKDIRLNLTDIDECANNPCQNGASCTNNGHNQYMCTCTPGWAGTACDTDIDECASNPCHNGASCTNNGLKQYMCTCTTGWTGTACDTGHQHENAENLGEKNTTSLLWPIVGAIAGVNLLLVVSLLIIRIARKTRDDSEMDQHNETDDPGVADNRQLNAATVAEEGMPTYAVILPKEQRKACAEDAAVNPTKIGTASLPENDESDEKITENPTYEQFEEQDNSYASVCPLSQRHATSADEQKESSNAPK